jgi:mannose-1-phosphate guanylyltransferase
LLGSYEEDSALVVSWREGGEFGSQGVRLEVEILRAGAKRGLGRFYASRCHSPGWLPGRALFDCDCTMLLPLMEPIEPTPMPPVLLLAGGLGTRLRPLTDRVPKCLAPVAGRPLLDYWQDSFIRHGVRNVTINVHAHREQVIEWVARRNAEGPVKWKTFEEPELLGSAGTLRANLSGLEEAEDFIVLYADNLSEIDLAAFVRTHRERDADFTMALFETPTPSACGIATLERDGTISAFVEKPAEPVSNLANAGSYVARSGLFHDLLLAEDFDLGHDVLPRLVGRMYGWRIEGYHRDVGSPESLAAIEADLRGGLAPQLVGQ